MPQKQKLKRVVDAYDRLKTDILTSKLSPDFQAPEPEIADMLGMSRTPVREALIRLQSEGLVDLVPRHGARVRSLGINDIQELHDILASLEAEVCHQLALRGVTLAEIEELNSFLSPISEAEAKGDFESWLDSDSRLRVRLFQMRGNQRLEHIGRVLLDQLHFEASLCKRSQHRELCPYGRRPFPKALLAPDPLPGLFLCELCWLKPSLQVFDLLDHQLLVLHKF